jgi:methionyl-tRNA synthetase
MARFGTDALRYYLMRAVSFGDDGSVSMEGVESRYESELANELGNLASRAISMVHRYRDGIVPAAPVDVDVLPDVRAEIAEHMDALDIDAALDRVWLLVRRLNQYVEERAPWKLAKDPAQAAELDRTLATLAEGVRVVAVLLLPWLPVKMEELLDALGADARGWDDAAPGDRPRVTSVEKIAPLFPKPERAAA